MNHDAIAERKDEKCKRCGGKGYWTKTGHGYDDKSVEVWCGCPKGLEGFRQQELEEKGDIKNSDFILGHPCGHF